MAGINNVTPRSDYASTTSSFLEVTGQSSIVTEATRPRTMSPVREEPPYSTPDNAFTELCATCLHRTGTRKAATHFCSGCDRRGRYMCSNCLNDHSVWCNKPYHTVHSLSVDRHCDNGYCYVTNEQSERGRPNRLFDKANDSVSENSEGTITQSIVKGRNLDKHRSASTPDLPMFDGVAFDDTWNLHYQRPKLGRSVSQLIEGQYDDITPRNQEATSHIYCDPIEMLRLPSIPDPHRRGFFDPYDCDHMSTATVRRLNDVYNDHDTHEGRVYYTDGHPDMALRFSKKKKACIIQ